MPATPDRLSRSGLAAQQLGKLRWRRAYWLARRRAELAAGDPNCILVLCPEKTGSTTLSVSLKRSLSTPVLHAHWTNEGDVENRSRALWSQGLAPSPFHLARGAGVARAVDNGRGPSRVITAVREPATRALSNFLQHVRDQELTVDQLRAGFQRWPFFGDTDSFFERQVVPMAGVDVYSEAFDPEQGWATFETGGVRHAVIRTDAINRAGGRALGWLVQGEPVELTTQKRTEDSAPPTHLVFRSAPGLPEDFVRRLQRARYARHFFSDDELESAVVSLTRGS